MKKTYLAACTAALLTISTSWTQASPVDNADDPAYVVKTVQADQAKAKTETPSVAALQAAAAQSGVTDRLVDSQAIPAVRSLQRYLAALPGTGRVIYGHQNDAHHKMFRISDGTESDTKDMTGSLSGIVGVDALSLTGDEMHPREAAKLPGDTLMDKLVNLSVKADREGAILTLSMHMPNSRSSRPSRRWMAIMISASIRPARSKATPSNASCRAAIWLPSIRSTSI